MRRCGGAEEEERTDNFWIQRSRNPTQNFVHPEAGGRRQKAGDRRQIEEKSLTPNTYHLPPNT
ncbi:MAG: hypothetical protein F6K41_40395 [Symploca sp. SIO3E6]|nr:hypothetical protein [Caldora sp. SIO3E6]